MKREEEDGEEVDGMVDRWKERMIREGGREERRTSKE